MNKQSQETITIPIPESISNAKDILARFGEGFKEHDKRLVGRTTLDSMVAGLADKATGGIESAADKMTGGIDAASDKIRGLMPRDLVMRESAHLNEDNTAGRMGAYARHYSPHILALLAALAGGYGISRMLNKEGSDHHCYKIEIYP